MKNQFTAALFLVFVLSGCGIDRAVAINELDWRPSKLTSDDCPNLSGDYAYTLTRNYSGGYESSLIRFYAGSVYLLWKTAKVNPTTGHLQMPLDHLKDLPDFQSFYIEASVKKSQEAKYDMKDVIIGNLHIDHTEYTFLQGRSDETRVSTKLQTEMTGCNGGNLIFRHLESNGGNDFVPRTVSYGEFEMRKNSDGSLTITERRRQRTVSFSNGMLDDRKEFPAVTRTYRPAGP